MWALLPVKRLQGAKKRLSSLLDEAERTALARAMLLDVFAALEGASSLDGIAVVTGDNEVAVLASERGHRVIMEPTTEPADGDRLNQALNHARGILQDDGTEGLMIIHGDVPAVTPDEIDRLAQAQTVAPFVTVARAHSDGGTNGMVMLPADVVSLHYGPDSAARHMVAAREVGAALKVAELEGLGLDIDKPEDLLALITLNPAGHTCNYLLESGLIDRLQQHDPC